MLSCSTPSCGLSGRRLARRQGLFCGTVSSSMTLSTQPSSCTNKPHQPPLSTFKFAPSLQTNHPSQHSLSPELTDPTGACARLHSSCPSPLQPLPSIRNHGRQRSSAGIRTCSGCPQHHVVGGRQGTEGAGASLPGELPEISPLPHTRSYRTSWLTLWCRKTRGLRHWRCWRIALSNRLRSCLRLPR